MEKLSRRGIFFKKSLSLFTFKKTNKFVDKKSLLSKLLPRPKILFSSFKTVKILIFHLSQ